MARKSQCSNIYKDPKELCFVSPTGQCWDYPVINLREPALIKGIHWQLDNLGLKVAFFIDKNYGESGFLLELKSNG